ncbi:unnamed protein product [Arabidopsis lyrata]|nr:unnamed protein product [Arabidopsis lyrata]
MVLMEPPFSLSPLCVVPLLVSFQVLHCVWSIGGFVYLLSSVLNYSGSGSRWPVSLVLLAWVEFFCSGCFLLIACGSLVGSVRVWGLSLGWYIAAGASTSFSLKPSSVFVVGFTAQQWFRSLVLLLRGRDRFLSVGGIDCFARAHAPDGGGVLVFVAVLCYRIVPALCPVGLWLVEFSDSFFFGFSGLWEIVCLVVSS